MHILALIAFTLSIVLTGMAVHRVFFYEHWCRWFIEDVDDIGPDTLEAYRRWSVPVLLVGAGGSWWWFLAAVRWV